jgi:ribosomal protein L11 methylase PrmA
MTHLRRVYRLAAELEEDLVSDLWLAGTLGVHSEPEPGGGLRLTAWFAPPYASAPAPRPGIECLSEDEVAEIDWMARYRQLARPFPVGRTLLVDPGEPEEGAGEAGPATAGQGVERSADQAAGPPAGQPTAPPELAGRRRLLRLPARTAFGTGSHESTALAVELLEESAVAGRAVLDVGTGTGILAFAALALGAARVVGFDADPAAAFQARANSRLNRLRPLLFAGRPAALAPRPAPGARFDLAVANVVPEQILPEIAGLLAALRPHGGLILSGLPAERAPEVLERLAASGWHEVERRQAGEWLALRLARTSRRRSAAEARPGPARSPRGARPARPPS